VCPIADGGEGTVDAMCAAGGGERRRSRVVGPRGLPLDAAWAVLEEAAAGGAPMAVLEMAAAAGLTLLEENQRDPERTTTFGVGQLIAEAIDAGAMSVLLGIGGSATCDAGCGAVQALGGRFYDAAGSLIDSPITGGDLSRIASLDVEPARERCRGVALRVACDVTNPLTGPDGAAYVYAPQKGADAAAVERLDDGLRHIAECWRQRLGVDVESHPGAGAAGGLGGGLLAMLNATLEPGIELVLEAVNFHERVARCDLCLTGEGKLDGQSLSGKAVLGVAKAAASHGVPTHALVGRIGEHAERTLHAGLTAYHEIARDLPDPQAMRSAAPLLQAATAALVRKLSH
jgi:glycerate 2-kinase